MLKEIGVDVYFQNERISLNEQEGEFMKIGKFFKFVAKTATVAVAVGSIAYIVKDVLDKKASDNFDDTWDDDFDDDSLDDFDDDDYMDEDFDDDLDGFEDDDDFGFDDDDEGLDDFDDFN